MYVRDLEEGCLLKPDPSYYWQIRPIKDMGLRSSTQWGNAAKELAAAGVMHHGSVAYSFGKNKDKPRRIGVYMGAKKLKDYYFGVKKQHIILVGSDLFVVDGYSFSKVQKIE